MLNSLGLVQNLSERTVLHIKLSLQLGDFGKWPLFLFPDSWHCKKVSAWFFRFISLLSCQPLSMELEDFKIHKFQPFSFLAHMVWNSGWPPLIYPPGIAQTPGDSRVFGNLQGIKYSEFPSVQSPVFSKTKHLRGARWGVARSLSASGYCMST